MISDMTSYPGGSAGGGLLLLRLTMGSCALSCVDLLCGGAVSDALVIGTVALILAGFCTRWSAVSAALILAVAAEWRMVTLIAIALAAVLALTGPGALSLDARLFGRRRVTLDPRAPREHEEGR